MAHAARRLFEEIDHMVRASQLADRGAAGVLNAGFATGVKLQLGPIGAHHNAWALAVSERVFLVGRLGIADFGVAQFIHGRGPS